MTYKAAYLHHVKDTTPQPKGWGTVDEFADYLRSIHVPVKDDAPLLKLARYDGTRNSENAVEFYGAQGDADSQKVSVEVAHQFFQMLDIEAVFQATHSEGVKPEHCWRVFARFSKSVGPERFHELVSLLNGVLKLLDPDATFAAESWTAGQAFFIGSGHPVLVSHGQLIDTVEGIEPSDNSGGRKAKRHDAPPVAAVEFAGVVSPADAATRERLLDAIRNATEGGRHAKLFGVTAQLYRLVSGGRLDPEGLEGEILAAATECGIGDSVNNQITRGIAVGMADPLTVEREADERLGTPTSAGRVVSNEEHEAHEDAAKRRAEQMALAAAIGEGLGDDAPLPVIMTVDEMLARLVSVGGTHVADKKTGRIRGVEAAAREYAASIHNWEDDGKPKSAPAIKIWQQRHTRLTVDGLTWQPGQPELCTLPEATEAGSRGLNTWRGLPPLPKPENWEELARPFVEHVAYLVPAEAERHRFLQWLAHMVQRPEELPHTCYLFVTPSFGIGRGWLAGVLARVMRGHAAIGVDLAQTLLGSFNGRLSRKLIAIVEEVREGAGTNRYTLANKFRDEITGEVRHINPKFGLQSVEKNCLRWLIFSQHLDAVPFDEGDRRVIVIANPEKGKDGGYYSRIYGLLNNRDFAGAVRHYLATYDLTGFNPGEHAPLNAAKREAAESMLSPVDVAVREYLDECDKPLIAVSAIRAHVILSGTSGISDTHFRHALQRAGIGKGRRIRMEDGRRETVAARRGGGWTVEMVNAAAPEALRALL